jgi:hypothetical protein
MKKIIALVLLLALPAQAEGLKYIPKWSMCGDRACYTLEQAKKLFELDGELELLYATRDLQLGIINDLKAGNAQLKLALTSSEQNGRLLQGSNDRLTEDLKAAVKRANDAEAKNSGISLGWFVAGAALCIAGGIAIGASLAHK